MKLKDKLLEIVFAILIAVIIILSIVIFTANGDQDILGDLPVLVKEREGFVPTPYEDSLGHLTIGYGTNIEVGISKQQADCMLEWKLIDDYGTLGGVWKPFRTLPLSVRKGLTDMAYQLGVSGVMGFTHMLDALAKMDYTRAIAEVKNSKWIQETPVRANDLIEVFKRYETNNT